jgi:transcriptional regulator with XRE-family HTH domain
MNTEMNVDAAKMNRIIFGSMIRNWRIQQGWTQYTAHYWAKEVGFDTISYGNLSVIESGKSGELRFASFLQFEELFRRLHERDYGQITNELTRKRVEDSRPICHPDGRPWDALDLIACYLGRKDVPEALTVPQAPSISDKALKALCSRWRRMVQRHAEATGDRTQALETLMRRVPDQDHARFRELLMGFDYTQQELAKLWLHTSLYQPEQWIHDWEQLENGYAHTSFLIKNQ